MTRRRCGAATLGSRARLSSPAELARARLEQHRSHGQQCGDDRPEDERDHPGGVDDRHVSTTAVLELDVAGRRDSAAASAALALLALARIRAAAGAEPEPRDGDRHDRDAVALHWRPIDG